MTAIQAGSFSSFKVLASSSFLKIQKVKRTQSGTVCHLASSFSYITFTASVTKSFTASTA